MTFLFYISCVVSLVIQESIAPHFLLCEALHSTSRCGIILKAHKKSRSIFNTSAPSTNCAHILDRVFYNALRLRNQPTRPTVSYCVYPPSVAELLRRTGRIALCVELRTTHHASHATNLQRPTSGVANAMANAAVAIPVAAVQMGPSVVGTGVRFK